MWRRVTHRLHDLSSIALALHTWHYTKPVYIYEGSMSLQEHKIGILSTGKHCSLFTAKGSARANRIWTGPTLSETRSYRGLYVPDLRERHMKASMSCHNCGLVCGKNHLKLRAHMFFYIFVIIIIITMLTGSQTHLVQWALTHEGQSVAQLFVVYDVNSMARSSLLWDSGR